MNYQLDNARKEYRDTVNELRRAQSHAQNAMNDMTRIAWRCYEKLHGKEQTHIDSKTVPMHVFYGPALDDPTFIQTQQALAEIETKITELQTSVDRAYANFSRIQTESRGY